MFTLVCLDCLPYALAVIFSGFFLNRGSLVNWLRCLLKLAVSSRGSMAVGSFCLADCLMNRLFFVVDFDFKWRCNPVVVI